jgi:hypothetical protein
MYLNHIKRSLKNQAISKLEARGPSAEEGVFLESMDTEILPITIYSIV